MGFSIEGVWVFRDNAVSLYDRVIVPGGGRFATPCEQQGLPSGWMLPLPRVIDHRLPEASGWAAARTEAEWREKLGAPPAEDPLDAFSIEEYQLAALLSLAGGSAILVLDDTHAGIIAHEHAAAFQRGRFVGAAGDELRAPSYVWHEGAYRHGISIKETPAAYCGALVDARFRGAFLYDGYFPRSVDQGSYRQLPDSWRGAPPIDPLVAMNWLDWFPGLGEAL